MDLSSRVSGYTDQQIKALITNHRNRGATDQPTYMAALSEQARRGGRGLTFERSVPAIWRSAAAGRFLSYKDLADASQADWSRVHYLVGKHLWQLIEFAYRNGWPVLSAVVVNKPNVTTGVMEPDTLRGFASASEALGYAFDDAEAFLHEQQRAVFEWAAGISEQDLLGLMNDHR